eukprot:SAG22_NODE_8531_length_648_cov_0.803279_2_plen_36_part_01
MGLASSWPLNTCSHLGGLDPRLLVGQRLELRPLHTH